MTIRRSIINALHDGPSRLLIIAHNTGYLVDLVASELHDMEDRGEVIQYETGLYQLSAATQQAEQQRARHGEKTQDQTPA